MRKLVLTSTLIGLLSTTTVNANEGILHKRRRNGVLQVGFRQDMRLAQTIVQKLSGFLYVGSITGSFCPNIHKPIEMQTYTKDYKTATVFLEKGKVTGFYVTNMEMNGNNSNNQVNPLIDYCNKQ